MWLPYRETWHRAYKRAWLFVVGGGDATVTLCADGGEISGSECYSTSVAWANSPGVPSWQIAGNRALNRPGFFGDSLVPIMLL
jgi:hypothetical protein